MRSKGVFQMKTEDKDDNVKKIEIHHGDMEAQQFQIGDLVYIDEDGNMESVMDKDSEE